MAKIISEGIISSVMDAIGFGSLWDVLKGRFWQMIRGFSAIVDIWKAETQEELEKVRKEYVNDVENIKTRYRSAEAAYAKQNSFANAAYGDNLMFFNPALAVSSAVAGPLLNQEYRQDTRRLLADTGIAEWGLTPSFISNWIDDEPNKEDAVGRSITYDKDGKVKKTDIFLYDKEDKDKGNRSAKMDAIMGLFIESNTQPTPSPTAVRLNEEAFTKEKSKQLAKKITAAYESQGIFQEMMDVANKIKEQKEVLIANVIEPSRKTIDLISKMLTSQTPEEFVQLMDQISGSNASLKNISPADFIGQIDAAVSAILNDEKTKTKLAQELKKDISEIDEKLLRATMFEVLRNKFAANVIAALDTVYENTLDLLMEGITEKGLKAIKQTDIGTEYANLIETNIQNLEEAIKSLEMLDKKEI
jgi:hypothetical protein